MSEEESSKPTVASALDGCFEAPTTGKAFAFAPGFNPDVPKAEESKQAAEEKDAKLAAKALEDCFDDEEEEMGKHEIYLSPQKPAESDIKTTDISPEHDKDGDDLD